MQTYYGVRTCSFRPNFQCSAKSLNQLNRWRVGFRYSVQLLNKIWWQRFSTWNIPIKRSEKGSYRETWRVNEPPVVLKIKGVETPLQEKSLFSGCVINGTVLVEPQFLGVHILQWLSKKVLYHFRIHPTTDCYSNTSLISGKRRLYDPAEPKVTSHCNSLKIICRETHKGFFKPQIQKFDFLKYPSS